MHCLTIAASACWILYVTCRPQDGLSWLCFLMSNVFIIIIIVIKSNSNKQCIHMLWFQIEELLKIIMMSSMPWFQIEELLKIIMMSSLPCFQIEELLKIIMMSSMPWFQIEELPKTKGFHHCQSDAGYTCPSNTCHQHGRWIIKGPHMTRSHLLRLSRAVNHYAMSQYQVAPHD